MNVGKAFLHDAKESNLHVRWKTTKIGTHLQIHLNAAALGKTFGIQMKGRRQANLIEQWWMEDVRHGAKLSTHVHIDRDGICDQSSHLPPPRPSTPPIPS